MVKIVISNCWSFYNKGDAAIAIATANMVRELIPDANITILAVDAKSFIEHKDAFKGNIKILPMIHTISPFRNVFSVYSILAYPGRGISSFFGIFYLLSQLFLFPFVRRRNSVIDNVLSEIDSADLILAVGGNYLYANKSFFNHILILVYGKFLKKKKILLLGHSIGPFDDRISKYTAKKLLSYTDLIIFRENISKEYIYNNITKKINYEISGDAAFLLKSHKVITSNPQLETYKVGISIRKWFHRSPLRFKIYSDAMRDIIISLLNNNHRVYIFPFSYIGGSEDDLDVCESIYHGLPEDLKTNATIMNLAELSPTEIIDLLIKLEIDIFIATRLHSAILASLSNVPALIISYQHFKAYGISRQLGLEDYVINIGGINFDQLNSYVDNMLDRSVMLKNKLNKSTKEIRQKVLFTYSSAIKRMIEIENGD